MHATQLLPNVAEERAALNTLFRCEVSAVEAYEQALRRFAAPDDRPATVTLARLRNAHTNMAEMLADRVRFYDALPPECTGVWDTFVNTLARAAKLLGPHQVLTTLRRGELYAYASYEKVVRSHALSDESKRLIRDVLIPRCEEHMVALDELIERLERNRGG